jgi:hypothetical protein
LNDVQRYSAQQALEHPWFKDVVVDGVVAATSLNEGSVDLSLVISELRRYNAFRKFRKCVLAIVAANRFKFRLSEFAFDGNAAVITDELIH